MTASSGPGERPLSVGLVARVFNNMPVWAAQRTPGSTGSAKACTAETLTTEAARVAARARRRARLAMEIMLCSLGCGDCSTQ